MRARARGWWLAAVVIAGCGSSTSGKDVPGADAMDDIAAIDVGFDVAADPGVDTALPDVPVTPDQGPSDPGVTPPLPWTPEARGFKVLRGIVHLHSLYSHDGCVPDHEGIAPEVFQQCLAEQRAAPCAYGIDFMMQTDHPGDMQEQVFEDTVHFQPADGDQVVTGADGLPLANRLACPAGSVVPRTYFYLGCEGSKNMPIGLSKTATAENGQKSVDPEIFHVSYDNDVPLATAQAAIAKVHAAGGYAFACHTEQGDISVGRIRDLPLDGMEMFNIHPMLMSALTDDFDAFLRVDRFMGKGQDNPSPDLAMLLLFKPVAKDPEKFDLVAPTTRLAAVGATDIHRNVEVPKLCSSPDEYECYEGYPNFSRLLYNGGPAILGDGDRMDSYARAFRWMANRTLVKSDAPNEPEEIRSAIGHGRSYLAFDVLGSPDGFDFFAVADGKAVEMSEVATGAKDLKFFVRAPRLVAPPWGMKHVTDFSTAEVVTKVIHATAQGATTVMEVKGQGATMAFTPDAPFAAGAVRIEVWVTPKHLVPALKGVEDLADRAYPFIYSNGIFVR